MVTISDTLVEEEQLVGTMAAWYNVIGTGTKATSEGIGGVWWYRQGTKRLFCN
jgi:hypothetical protein